MPSFTLNLLDSGSLEVSLKLKEDNLMRTYYHLYVTSINWKSYMGTTAKYRLSVGDNYKTGSIAPYFVNNLVGTEAEIFTTTPIATNNAITLTGPTTTSNIFSCPSSGPSVLTSGNPLDTSGSGRGDVGAILTGAPFSAYSYLGTYRGSGDSQQITTKFTLQYTTDNGASWVDLAEVGGNATYDFTFNNTDYTVNIAYDTNVANHVNLPILYCKSTFVMPTGITQIAIGYSSYTPSSNDTIVAGAGNSDFVLMLPKDVTASNVITDTVAVDDYDTIVIPAHAKNLFSMALLKIKPTTNTNVVVGTDGNTTGNGTNAIISGVGAIETANIVSRSTIRNATIINYAESNWPEIYIRTVSWDKTPTSTKTIVTNNVNYGSFLLHGGQTTFTIARVDAKCISFTIVTSLGSASKTNIDSIEIVPYLPAGTIATTVPSLS